MNRKKTIYGFLVWSVIASTCSILILGWALWKEYYYDKDAFDYIVTERVSLLDWGITRVEEVLESSSSPLMKTHKIFVYHEDKSIILSASTAWDVAKNRKIGIAWCEGLVDEIREFFLIDSTSGTPKHGAHSSISVYFQHKYYTTLDNTQKFARSLDKLIKIEAIVHVEKEKNKIKCEGPLVGKGVKFI